MALSRAALVRAANLSASETRLPPRSGMLKITAAEARPRMISTTISSTSVKPLASSRTSSGASRMVLVFSPSAMSPLVTFQRGRIERIALHGEIKMPSRKFVRAILAFAGVAVVAWALSLLPQRGNRAPDPQPGNDFDPADFVRGRPRLDAPFIASDLQVVDAMLGLARVRPNDNVIDLGSGDGRILISAARSLGAHGLGVDIDPARIRESTANAE